MRKRIALEYADHLALRPRRGGAAGNPEELAGEFAAELAADDARRVARNTFAALALAALALVAGQLTIAAAGGYLGYSGGLSTALAVPTILTILIASQIALVAGSLAALRALRRRQSRRLPAGEGRDVQPRVLLSGCECLLDEDQSANVGDLAAITGVPPIRAKRVCGRRRRDTCATRRAGPRQPSVMGPRSDCSTPVGAVPAATAT